MPEAIFESAGTYTIGRDGRCGNYKLLVQKRDFEDKSVQDE